MSFQAAELALSSHFLINDTKSEKIRQKIVCHTESSLHCLEARGRKRNKERSIALWRPLNMIAQNSIGAHILNESMAVSFTFTSNREYAIGASKTHQNSVFSHINKSMCANKLVPYTRQQTHINRLIYSLKIIRHSYGALNNVPSCNVWFRKKCWYNVKNEPNGNRKPKQNQCS